MSMHDDPALVLRAREVGAHGFITKGVSAHELVDLCRQAMTDEWLVSSDLGSGVPISRRPTITARETEVLRALLGGDAPKRVADRLGMSDKSLYRHRAICSRSWARGPWPTLRVLLENADSWRISSGDPL